jgi:hypothetical protein
MDTTAILVAGGVVVLLIAGALIAWRMRSDTVITMPAAAPPGPSHASPYSAAELAHMAAAGKLVEMRDPLVRRSAEQALAKGGPWARYFVRHAGKLWITFEPLPDQYERERAYDMFRRFNAGEEIDIRTMLEIIGKLGR